MKCLTAIFKCAQAIPNHYRLVIEPGWIKAKQAAWKPSKRTSLFLSQNKNALRSPRPSLLLPVCLSVHLTRSSALSLSKANSCQLVAASVDAPDLRLILLTWSQSFTVWSNLPQQAFLWGHFLNDSYGRTQPPVGR